MPLIIAHRGASAEAPENTMLAFELAQRHGADMLELDLLPTADGRIAVFHDETTARWERQARPVAACTLSELQRLDLGQGTRVPALEEVLALAAETGIALNLEFKATGMASRCAALIREFGILDLVVVSSFLPAALHELRAADPAVRRAYLMGTDTRRPDVRLRELWPFFALRAVEAAAWHPYHDLPALDQVIPVVLRAGYQINVWTVDDPARMLALTALGVHGIITNQPKLALETLRG